jgi:hypothetical protein
VARLKGIEPLPVEFTWSPWPQTYVKLKSPRFFISRAF